VGSARQRERERARGKGTAPTDRPHRAARGREGVSAQAGADRWGPPVRHRGHVGADARGAGPAWAKWAEMVFSISREFLMPFLFIFSRVFNSIQIKFQIQTKSIMCNNSKNIWGST
jgi:hypothetical protein